MIVGLFPRVVHILDQVITMYRQAEGSKSDETVKAESRVNDTYI